MIDNRIGILFNSSMLFRLTRGRSQHESIHNYEEAACRHHLQPVYFRLEDINLRTMMVRAYVRKGSHYIRRRIPLPQVIHNRAIYKNSSLQAKLRTLTSRPVQIFNQVNRYGKLKIHEILMQDSCLAPHLPETMMATINHIPQMMSRHHSLILKPDNSSVGKGIMKIERTEYGWQAEYSIRTKKGKRVWRRSTGSGERLPQAVRTQLNTKKYLVQETLPLASYQGRPFDLRVSVQRDGSGTWQVTGIVGKVAPSHTFVTNVAQGGHVVPFEQIAASTYPEIPFSFLTERITAFALRVADRLSSTLPHMADLGLDIGLSSDGTPLFIECNGRDQRYSFLEAKLTETWKATYENPIAYGACLLSRSSRFISS